MDLLNIYEVDDGGTPRHVVCFLEPVLAGSVGIDERSVVGEFTPGPAGEFDHRGFQANPGFVEALTEYMNTQAGRTPELAAQARTQPGGWLYLIDPRAPDDPADEPAPEDLVGCFAVDDRGLIVAGSFRYNRRHVLFDPRSGVSGVLADRRFYDWLHPLPGGAVPGADAG